MSRFRLRDDQRERIKELLLAKRQTTESVAQGACLSIAGRFVPTLGTDAGFRRPWFQAVETLGWHYIGRVANCDLYRTTEGYRESVKPLYSKATCRPCALGDIEMTRSAPHVVLLYCTFASSQRGASIVE